MTLGGIITRKQILARIQSDQLISNAPPVSPNVISSGPSICGYDLTLDTEFLSISTSSVTSDPKYAGSRVFGEMSRGKSFAIGPGEVLIAQSVEVIKMPLDLVGIATQRSVYNNFGVVVNMPNLLPGYVGKARFTITNFSKNGVILYPKEGICSLMFHTVSLEDGEVGEAYTGKYNGMDEISVLPPVNKS